MSTAPESPLSFGFNLPFAEQAEFLRQKLNLPTKAYDDITHAAHDRSFVVAGAMKADLLTDLHSAVQKAVDGGTTLETFRKDFREIVAKNGWHGWTGEGTAEGEAWRTRVIYETNLSTSYAAGRYAQLTDPDLLKVCPYWKYVHDDDVTHPRPEHVALDSLVLRHDHPFWKTHYPPNGWGCRCRVTAVAAPGEGDKTEPPKGWDAINPKTGAPVGIDKGWDYAPGASVADDLREIVAAKAEKLPPELGIPFHEMAVKNAEVSLERGFGKWVDDVFDTGVSRNQTAVLGMMSEIELSFWTGKMGAAPESAAVAVEDRLLVGKKAERHLAAGDALTKEEWKQVATKMRLGDREAYFDTEKQNIVYLFTLSRTDKRKAKIAVEVDFKEKRSGQKMNLARAAFKQDPNTFEDKKKYWRLQ